jgi:hypothetical protein
MEMHMSDYMKNREEILSSIAERLGKSREDLIPWTDYDPIMVDESAFRLAKNSNWTGD